MVEDLGEQASSLFNDLYPAIRNLPNSVANLASAAFSTVLPDGRLVADAEREMSDLIITPSARSRKH